jgi:hypothetical protein
MFYYDKQIPDNYYFFYTAVMNAKEVAQNNAEKTYQAKKCKWIIRSMFHAVDPTENKKSYLEKLKVNLNDKYLWENYKPVLALNHQFFETILFERKD